MEPLNSTLITLESIEWSLSGNQIILNRIHLGCNCIEEQKGTLKTDFYRIRRFNCYPFRISLMRINGWMNGRMSARSKRNAAGMTYSNWWEDDQRRDLIIIIIINGQYRWMGGRKLTESPLLKHWQFPLRTINSGLGAVYEYYHPPIQLATQ